MAKMRIIADAYAQLKKDDPKSAITKGALRRMVNQRVIPAVQVGRKTLINYDQLLVYLNAPTAKSVLMEHGQIRKVH